MNTTTRVSFQEAGVRLKNGKIGVLPTDTAYSFVASAFLSESVERLYHTCGWNDRKPIVVLLSHMDDIKLFGRALSFEESRATRSIWPGRVTIVFSGFYEEFLYLHHGTGVLAFRVPNVLELRDMLRISGPIITSSSNPIGKESAKTVEEAEAYFGDQADFFVDGGTVLGSPSTVVRFEAGHLMVVRRGAAEELF